VRVQSLIVAHLKGGIFSHLYILLEIICIAASVTKTVNFYPILTFVFMVCLSFLPSGIESQESAEYNQLL
jgi:hypothetical protein